MGKKEISYIVITAILFSTMEVALKIAGNELDAFQVTFIRFAIGGLFLLPFALMDMKKRQVSLSRSDLLYLTGLGVLCICISMLFFQVGIIHANANLVSVIICSNPIYVMIFAHFIVKDRFTKRKALVLIISSIGLIFAANPFNLSEGNTAFGIICAFIAAVTFGLYTTIGKLRIAKIGDIPQTCFSFLIGSIVMLIPMLIMDKPIIAGIDSSNILMVLYIGVAVTGIGYYTYFQAIHTSGPSNASIVFFLKPMFAPLIALAVLHESLTWNIILGIVLLLTGSLINLLGARKNSAQAKPITEKNDKV
ncbi:MAG: EamA family transporter [Firmicutes bacterium]|nr:EamA family transporter [Bacillota bacterium]